MRSPRTILKNQFQFLMFSPEQIRAKKILPMNQKIPQVSPSLRRTGRNLVCKVASFAL